MLRTCLGVSDVEGKFNQFFRFVCKGITFTFFFLLHSVVELFKWYFTSMLNKTAYNDNELAENRRLPASGEGGAVTYVMGVVRNVNADASCCKWSMDLTSVIKCSISTFVCHSSRVFKLFNVVVFTFCEINIKTTLLLSMCKFNWHPNVEGFQIKITLGNTV